MKKITLLKAKLTNFKGIESLEIDFSENTKITATNGIGKTTIGDAFYWVLFGKDQMDRKDHEIKNSFKPELNRQDHEVEFLFDVDGKRLPLKRVYSEKWTTRKGAKNQEMTGHSTDLFFDDVPCTLSEFNARLSQLIGSEETIKLLSNPLYFNTDRASKWGWKERRSLLVDMAGEISDELVFKGMKGLEYLQEILKTKDIQDYKKVIAAQKKAIQEQLDPIPIQIKEVLRSRPESLDWDSIQSQIDQKQKEVSKIDDQIADKSKALESFYEEDQKITSQINAKRTELQDLKFKAEQEAKEANKKESESIDNLTDLLTDSKTKIDRYQARVNQIESSIKELEERSVTLESEKAKLLTEYHEQNSKELKFDAQGFVCPTCNRPHEADHVEAEKQRMIERFNKDKVDRLESIKSKGAAKNLSIESNEKEIQTLKESLLKGNDLLQEEKDKYQTLFSHLQDEQSKPIKEYTYLDFYKPESIESEIKKLESSRKAIPTIDNSELKAKKSEIQIEIDSLKDQLRLKSKIEESDLRVKELETNEREFSNEKTRLQGIENDILEFTNRKMTMVEESVNANFKYVRFKMFNTLINGGTEETCETIMNEVSWNSLSGGQKIKAGIDIINAFSKHYGLCMPIVIDNAESVASINLPDTQSQVIRLIMNEDVKKLTVS